MTVRDFASYCERYGLLDCEMECGVELPDGMLDNVLPIEAPDFDIDPENHEIVLHVQKA